MSKATLQDAVKHAAKPRGSGNGRMPLGVTKKQASPGVTQKQDQAFTKRISPGPAREGKRVIAGFFDPAASKQLRRIALDEDSSIQELLREALNALFVKRGLPPLA
jgi:hypothetical protein